MISAMIQEVVNTFWQTSGITGVAIWELGNHLHLFTKRRITDWEKDALSKIIADNLNEYVRNTNHSHFPIMGNYAYTYLDFPLPPLVILTQSETFKPLNVANLQLALKQDYLQVIDIFQNLAKIEQAKPIKQFRRIQQLNTSTSVKSIEPDTEQFVYIKTNTTIEELVNVINQLSSLCVKYIGPNMTLKYLEQSRPEDSWLANFQFTKHPQISFLGNAQEELTNEQKILVKQWLKDFLKESTTVLSYLPTLIQKSPISEQLKLLLSS
jgi:hypothetical protein